MRTDRPNLPTSLLHAGACAWLLLCGTSHADPILLTFQPEPPKDGTTQPSPSDQPVIPAAHPAVPPLNFNPDWTFKFEPMLWYVGPSGKLRLPVNSGTGPGGFTTPGDEVRVNDLNLATTRVSPAGMLTVAHERWRFTFAGAAYSVSHGDVVADQGARIGAVAYGAGDHLSTSLDFATYEATVGYRLWAYDFAANSEQPGAATPAKIAFYGYAGARIYDLDTEVSRVSPGFASSSFSHVFAEPILGVRIEATVAENFNLVLQLAGGLWPGSGTSTSSVDLLTAFEWRATKTLGLEIGWRQVAFDLKHGHDLDEFEYDGRLAGLFASIVIRF